jgi:hypothetical protein
VPTNWVPMPDQPANTLVMANRPTARHRFFGAHAVSS